MPIRLRHTATTCRVLPLSRIQLGIGRGAGIAGDSKQGAEGIERVEPPIETESELIEVGLQMLVANSVMYADQPRL